MNLSSILVIINDNIGVVVVVVAVSSLEATSGSLSDHGVIV